MNVLLLTDKPEDWTENMRLLKEKGLQTTLARSTPEAASILQSNPPSLMLIDATPLAAHEVRALVGDLLMANAMVNMAVASSIPEPEFHDATEGLGILMQISRERLPVQIDALLAALRALIPSG